MRMVIDECDLRRSLREAITLRFIPPYASIVAQPAQNFESINTHCGKVEHLYLATGAADLAALTVAGLLIMSLIDPTSSGILHALAGRITKHPSRIIEALLRLRLIRS